MLQLLKRFISVGNGSAYMKMVVYVKTGDDSAEWCSVCRVKSTGPSTEPCGTPYESVILSDRVSFFYGLVPILQIRKKIEPAQIFHTNLKMYC